MTDEDKQAEVLRLHAEMDRAGVSASVYGSGGWEQAIRQRLGAPLCRCPNRPYGPSLASGSSWEQANLRGWEEEHGAHPYAQARDTLAKALQYAEGTVRDGAAVLDMVNDVYGLQRRKET